MAASFVLAADPIFRLRFPLGLDEFALQIPKDNEMDWYKVQFGRYLFFDKRLSRDGTVSCATCHNPRLAWTDGLAKGVGIGGHVLTRNTPTIINRVFSVDQFWDGRAVGLEEQVLSPFTKAEEMGNRSVAEVAVRLNKIPDYRGACGKAFGTDTITGREISRAIAAFERTIVSGNSPYDRFEVGGDEKALTETQKAGLILFRASANCVLCHNGFNFTDEEYHNLGIGNDPGRYNVTHKKEDWGKFKTPSLREVTRTGPYMHDGSLRTLEEVIDFYDRGGTKNSNLDSEMRPLGLTARQKQTLIAFLHALEGEGWQQDGPNEVPK